MAGQAGFEPATSRWTVEVTEFFTTGRRLLQALLLHSNMTAVVQLFRWEFHFERA